MQCGRVRQGAKMPALLAHQIAQSVDVDRLAGKGHDRNHWVAEDVKIRREAGLDCRGEGPGSSHYSSTRFGVSSATLDIALSTSWSTHLAPMWFITAHEPAKRAPGRDPARDGLA